VAGETGQDGCGGSPYDQWSDYMIDSRQHPRVVFDAKSRKLAQAELDFLKSLSPLQEPDAASREGDGNG
jgi:hypothetical protein